MYEIRAVTQLGWCPGLRPDQTPLFEIFRKVAESLTSAAETNRKYAPPFPLKQKYNLSQLHRKKCTTTNEEMSKRLISTYIHRATVPWSDYRRNVEYKNFNLPIIF